MEPTTADRLAIIRIELAKVEKYLVANPDDGMGSPIVDLRDHLLFREGKLKELLERNGYEVMED